MIVWPHATAPAPGLLRAPLDPSAGRRAIARQPAALRKAGDEYFVALPRKATSPCLTYDTDTQPWPLANIPPFCLSRRRPRADGTLRRRHQPS